MNQILEKIIAKGAILIDVRTPEEFGEGHIKGSINIPLDEICNATDWLLKDVPIIVYCASGARSEMAKNILEEKGFKEVYNGGSWNNFKGHAGTCPIK